VKLHWQLRPFASEVPPEMRKAEIPSRTGNWGKGRKNTRKARGKSQLYNPAVLWSTVACFPAALQTTGGGGISLPERFWHFSFHCGCHRYHGLGASCPPDNKPVCLEGLALTRRPLYPEAQEAWVGSGPICWGSKRHQRIFVGILSSRPRFRDKLTPKGIRI